LSKGGAVKFMPTSSIIAHLYPSYRAEKAGVPEAKINETVRSLSAHMGWDITVGSGYTTMDNEGDETLS
jgi:hypothetical protein